MDGIKCPFCGSERVRLREALEIVRIVATKEGGPGRPWRFAVYVCRSCGQSFEEPEGELLEDPEDSRGY